MFSSEKRLPIFWAMIFAVCIFLFSYTSSSEVENGNGSNNEKTMITLAVAEFVPSEELSNEITSSLSRTARDVLDQSFLFSVLSREQMLRQLEEAKFEQALFCHQFDCSVALGEALQVPFVLSGSIDKLKDKFTVILSLVDVTHKKELTSASRSSVCTVRELDYLVRETLALLLYNYEQIIHPATPTMTPPLTPTSQISPRRTPTPTATVTDIVMKKPWFKRYYVWAIGALAVGGAAVGLDSGSSGGANPTSTPTPTATPDVTATETYTPTPTRTFTPTMTPTVGCNPNTWEAYISDQFGNRFYMNCYESQNVYLEKPENMVTWYEARNACLDQGEGKRLCTIDEWQFACHGLAGFNYPYGYTYLKYKCYTELGLYDGPFKSGGKPECVSQFGIYDLSGNVAEWSSSPVEDQPNYYYKLGGNWAADDEFGCYEAKPWAELADNIWTGYRCCRDLDTQFTRKSIVTKKLRKLVKPPQLRIPLVDNKNKKKPLKEPILEKQ